MIKNNLFNSIKEYIKSPLYILFCMFEYSLRLIVNIDVGNYLMNNFITSCYKTITLFIILCMLYLSMWFTVKGDLYFYYDIRAFTGPNHTGQKTRNSWLKVVIYIGLGGGCFKPYLTNCKGNHSYVLMAFLLIPWDRVSENVCLRFERSVMLEKRFIIPYFYYNSLP